MAIAISLRKKNSVYLFHCCQCIRTVICAIAISLSREMYACFSSSQNERFIVVSIRARKLLLLYALARLAFLLPVSKNNSY